MSWSDYFLKNLLIFNWRMIALHKSAIGIHMSPPSHLLPLPTKSHPSKLSMSTSMSSLSHTANSHWLCILHMVVFMPLCYSFHSSHPLLYSQVCCLYLCFHRFLANRFISTTFLDSIYMHWYTIFVFSFWFTSLCIIDSRFIHLIITFYGSIIQHSFLMAE